MAYNFNTEEALKKGTATTGDLNIPGLSTYKGKTITPSPAPITPTKKPVTTPVVNVKTLTSTVRPVTVPKTGATASNASSAINSQAGAMTDLMKEQQARQDKLTPQVESQESTIRGYLNKLAGKGVAQLEAEETAGIPKLNQELTDITNQIEAKQLAYRRQIEKIQDNKAGLFGGAVEQEVARVERESARELADLSIIQNARNRNLATAQDLVNRKIELEYGDLKDRIEAEKYFYEQNRDDLSKAEQNTLNLKIKQDEREYDEKVTLEKAKQDLIIKASENQNVPVSVIQQAQRAKTPSEVASILGPYTLTKTSSGALGVSGGASSMTSAIIENPSLFDDLTPTVKGKVIAELQASGYDTSNLGLKGLSDTAINTISQSQKALSDLDELRAKIEGNEEFIGPVTGFARLNPYSKARQVQADVDRVRQTVGKALEGGVLRKEDEEKYKKILATLNDTPATAIYKIDALKSSIQRDIENYKSLQQMGGRTGDVGASLQKKGQTINIQDLRSKYGY